MWTLFLHEVSGSYLLRRACADEVWNRCAIDRFIKSPKCYACGAPTSGIFNKAEKILAKLEAKQKRKREERGILDEPGAGDGGIQFGGGSDEDRGDGDDAEGGADEDDDDED